MSSATLRSGTNGAHAASPWHALLMFPRSITTVTSFFDTVASFFNNASVGAFFGAAAAFFLVVANDWRRTRRRAQKILPAVLKREAFLVENRIATTPNTLDEKAEGRLIEHKSLCFSVGTIRRHADELADYLTDRQTMSLHNIAVGMESADDLNARAVEIVQRINEAKVESLADYGVAARRSAELERLYSTELNTLKEIRVLIRAYLTETLDERGGPPDPREAMRTLVQRSHPGTDSHESAGD